jgi:hypothetical protein
MKFPQDFEPAEICLPDSEKQQILEAIVEINYEKATNSANK